jgi:hypothetical protein
MTATVSPARSCPDTPRSAAAGAGAPPPPRPFPPALVP